MGRSYWYECPKCGYRAKVSGRADRGLNFFIQTISCRDCRELYDAVTRVRVVDEASPWGGGLCWRNMGLPKAKPRVQPPPTFQAVLNRLMPRGAKRFRWLTYKPQCPVSAFHRVRIWNHPDKCPKCGIHLEQGAVAYRLWD